MGTFTANGYIYKPATSEINYKTNYDSAADIADAQIKSNKDHKTAQDAISGLLKCNGSGTYTAAAQPYLVLGSNSTQNPTDTYADVTGSSVSYTPKTGSSKVLYGFTCQLTKATTGVGYIWFKLLNNGAEVSNARRSLTLFAQGDMNFTYFHVMDTWSGAHTLKLQARSLTGNIVTINQTHYMDGAASTTNQYNNVVVLEF